MVGKTVRLGTRTATIVGVLEPSVPYPAETEIIANVVTSPHHLSATMVTGRVHRMTELFGAARARRDLRGARGTAARFTPRCCGSIRKPTRQKRTSGSTRSCCATRSPRVRERCCWCCWPPSGSDLHHRLLECGQSDSGAHGAARRRTRHSRRAGRQHRRAAPNPAGREPGAVRQPARRWAS